MSQPKIVAWTIYGVLLAIALFFALTAPAGATTSTTSFTASAGWTQIAQFTSGAAPQNFSSIPQTYDDLLIVYDNVTFGLSSSNIAIKLSGDNGSTKSSGFIASGASSTTQAGSIFIPGYRKNSGAVFGCNTTPSASPMLTSCGGSFAAWFISGGINYIQANQVGTLNSGTITLYGR